MEQSLLMLLCFVSIIGDSFGTILNSQRDIVRRSSNSNINTNINVNHNRKLKKSSEETPHLPNVEDESNETMSGEKIGIISDENFDNEKLLVTAAATAAADASKVIAELLINELSETISDAVGEAVAKILLSKKKSLTKATAKALISRRSQSTNSNVNVNNNHHRKPVEPIESSENFENDNDDFDNKLITKKKQLARWPDDDTHYGEKKINNELKDDCGNPIKKRANSRRCFKRLIQQLFFE